MIGIDLRRRRVVAAALALMLGLSVALPAATSAGPSTVVFDENSSSFRVKPARFGYHQPGVSYRFTGIRWSAWGQPKARGRGRVTVCPNGGSCKKRSVTVTLDRRAAGLCDDGGTPRRAYRRLVAGVGPPRPLTLVLPTAC